MAEFFMKIMCCYCQQEIHDLRIKCADCKDFYICPECFKCGAEIGSHRNYHRYQFENPDTAPLCGGSNGWTAREEFLLLDAIEQYGYGNWEDISDHVETRNAHEALNEYVSRCIEGSIGRLTWSTAANNKPDLNKQIKPDVGPLSPTITSKLPQLNVSPEDAKVLGYMPQRDDFEREHDNSAEDLVSPLFISSLEDDELDIGHLSDTMSENKNSQAGAVSMFKETDSAIVANGVKNIPVKGTENIQVETVTSEYLVNNPSSDFKSRNKPTDFVFSPLSDSLQEKEKTAEKALLKALKNIIEAFEAKDITSEVAEHMVITINNIFVEAFQNVHAAENSDISVFAAPCAIKPLFVETAVNPSRNVSIEGNQSVEKIFNLLSEVNQDISEDTSCSLYVERAKDTVIETAKDTALETAKDTAIETAKDTTIETAKDTAIKTAKDTTIETAKDTAIETAKDIQNVAAKNIQENTTKDISIKGSQNLTISITENLLAEGSSNECIEGVKNLSKKTVSNTLDNEADDGFTIKSSLEGSESSLLMEVSVKGTKDVSVTNVNDASRKSVKDVTRQSLTAVSIEAAQDRLDVSHTQDFFQNLQLGATENVSVSPAAIAAVGSVHSKVDNSKIVSDILTDSKIMTASINVPTQGSMYRFEDETEETIHLSNEELEYLVMVKQEKLMKTRQMYFELKMGARV